MRLLVDENIPYGAEAFECFGDVSTFPGGSINPDHIREAGALLVRSVTTVDETLLKGSEIKFVGTATSGTDHVDMEYLAANDIRFVDAHGANARSVAEYVIAAILEIAEEQVSLPELRCGIVGYGSIGREVYRLMSSLGIHCVAVDPFIDAPNDGPALVSLEEAADCDILTFHVPLTTTGEYPTAHMIDARLLELLRDDVLLINAARGGILDAASMLSAKRRRPTMKFVLDVFEYEPNIDIQLAEICSLATPHIAGYSWDAKVEGTRRLFDALNEWNTTAFSFPDIPDTPPPPRRALRPPEAIGSVTSEIRHGVRQIYDIRADDRALREGIQRERVEGEGNIGAVFDTLRRRYAPRREFPAVRIKPQGWSTDALAALHSLGVATE